jgi:hypothetical protein
MRSVRRTLVLCSVLALASVSAARANTFSVGSTSATATTNGNALRRVLSSAQPGDVIYLTAGATFEGPFQLPQKSGSGSITIRTSTPDQQLPAGTRVSPDNAALMPTLVPLVHSTNAADSVITTAPGAGYYRLVGLEIATPRYLYNLVALGTASETSWRQLPHHITVDRCYVHGSSAAGTRRGIAANAGQGTTLSSGNPANDGNNPQDDIVITSSFFADFKDSGGDSQAVAAWNGYGPFRFENNYFEGAGENVMFGGTTPSIRALVPSNITIRRNHLYKPLSWFNGAEAGQWWVKNLLELDNAQYVTIEGNVFENNWASQQNGMGILFAPGSQNGTCSWCVVQSVTFTENILQHSAGGMNIRGYDDLHGSRQLNHLTVQNNLFWDISDGSWGTSSAAGRLFEVDNQTDHVTINHNTGLQTKAATFSRDRANTAFVFTNNVVMHNSCAGGDDCGMAGAGENPGLPALGRYFVGAVVTGNVMFQGNETAEWTYPEPNSFPASVSFNSDFTLNMSDTNTAGYVDGNGAPLGIDSWVDTATVGVVQYTNP